MERNSVSPRGIMRFENYHQRKYSEQGPKSSQPCSYEAKLMSPRYVPKEYYPMTPTHTSKVSTRESHISRRSSLNEVKQEQSFTLPKDNHTEIFSKLSHLLQNEAAMMQLCRDKLDTAKAKAAKGFAHLKQQLGMVLDRIETAMHQKFDCHYRQFIGLFESTKQLVHELYNEKVRYFEAAERNIQELDRQEHMMKRPTCNNDLLRSIRQQNAEAALARKYELFFKDKAGDFEAMLARRSQINDFLQTEIFDYSANNSKLRQLKKEFEKLAESLYKTSQPSVHPYNLQ